MGRSSPSVRIILMAWFLGINVAMALGIWPCWIYHICWLGETVPSGVRKWTGVAYCQTRTPIFSPLLMVHIPFQVLCISIGQDFTRTTGSLWWFTLGCKNNTHPGEMFHGKLHNAFPRCDGACGSMVRVRAMAISQDFCIFTELITLAGVPNLAYGATGPTGWYSNA